MDNSAKSIVSSQVEEVKPRPKTEVMVVGELHKVVGTQSLASTLCDISVMTITDAIKEKTKPTNSKILLVSEGHEENIDFLKVRSSLVSSGYPATHFLKMVELSDRTLEQNPQLRNIIIVHSILMLLRDLDYYQSNPDDRFNTQFGMEINIKYFEFLLRMYKLVDIFDENVKQHFTYIANIIVYKRTVFGHLTFNYNLSFKEISNFLRDNYFVNVPPSIQEVITELIEIKSIQQRINKYDTFRKTLREIRDNILVSRIVKNSSNFDFIVVIFGSGHYENICKLISEREELALSEKSFNPYNPSHLLALEQTLLSSLFGSTLASI